MSWTNEVALEFIELYRREQLLWDPKHPLHRNRSEVSDAWSRIQSSLSINCSVTDLKKKKESLMTSFRLHWNKKRKSPDTYRTSWYAYPIMESFLGVKYECDSTNANVEQEFFNNTNATYNQSLSDHTGYVSRNVSAVDKNKVSRPPIRSMPQSEANEMLYAKKQMDEAVTYLKKTAVEHKGSDEYDLYGQLLAKKLRKLDEHQRDVAMHEIDNIMFRAKMQGSTSQRSYSSSPSPIPRKTKSPVFVITGQDSSQHYEDENISYQEHSIQVQPQP